jgi:valyl-tRNA synthetase
MARMQDLVRAVREIRNRYQLDPKIRLEVWVRCNPEIAQDFRVQAPFIESLAGVGRLECGDTLAKPKQAAGHVQPDFEAYVSLAGLIDAAAETKRLEKQLAEKQKFLQTTLAKLANPNFADRAPADVVQQQHDLVTDLQNQIQRLETNLDELRQG